MGNVGGYVERAIREGMSQRRTEELFRQNDIQVSRQTVRDTYKDVRESMLARGDVQGLPYHRIPEMDYFSPWEAGRPGRYAYQVNVRIMDTDTGEIVERPWTVMSDEPISINKAIAMAIDQAEQGIASGQYETEVVQSAQIEALYATQ